MYAASLGGGEAGNPCMLHHWVVVRVDDVLVVIVFFFPCCRNRMGVMFKRGYAVVYCCAACAPQSLFGRRLSCGWI